MSGARHAVGGILSLAVSLALLSCLCSCHRASVNSSAPTSCGSDSDCAGGEVCGFSNAGGDRSCDARGECVTPLDPQPTMLCGCGGKSIELVVNDVDAGQYYWSGVIQGEQGFPPCGDAAVAPSADGTDAADASEPNEASSDSPADASIDGEPYGDASGDVGAQ